MGVEKLIPGVAQFQEAAKLSHSPVARGVAAVALAATLGGGLGIVDNFRRFEGYLPRLHTQSETALGKAKVITLETNLDEQRFVGFVAKVEKSRVGIETRLQIPKLGVNLPTGISMAEVFSGPIDADICQKATKQKMVYDPNTHKVEIDIPKDSLSVCTETVLKDRLFTPDNGIITASTIALNALARGLPKVPELPGIKQSIDAQNSMTSFLANSAEIQAHQQVIKQCAPKVWPLLEPAFEKRVKANALMYFKVLDPSMTEANLTLKLGDTTASPLQQINFSNSEDAYVQSLKTAKIPIDLSAEKSGVGSCVNVAALTNASNSNGATQ